MKTKWLGLWKQEREGFYAGQVIKKSEIPKYTRIVLRYNKWYEKDGNKPRFIFSFADSEGYEKLCIPIEIANEDMETVFCKKDADGRYYDENGERLFTREEARKIINGTYADCAYGFSDTYDTLPEDFV